MSPMDPMQRDHTEHQDFPWTINVADHPPRTESAQYKASRKLMRTLVATTDGEWPFVPGPGSAGYEDHHGGGVWVSDHDGWLCVLLPLGIEWSAQFCAAPEKVDRIRRCAARVVSAFPDTLPGYAALGYDDGERLLGTPIRTAGQVAEWTDSIFNASVPLPRGPHSGVLPNAAGYHHYPKPIVDIDHFRRDDFELFVTDERGLPVVVVPLAPAARATAGSACWPPMPPRPTRSAWSARWHGPPSRSGTGQSCSPTTLWRGRRSDTSRTEPAIDSEPGVTSGRTGPAQPRRERQQPHGDRRTGRRQQRQRGDAAELCDACPCPCPCPCPRPYQPEGARRRLRRRWWVDVPAEDLADELAQRCTSLRPPDPTNDRDATRADVRDMFGT